MVEAQQKTEPSYDTPSIFADMESRGLCDGFLWPYEGGKLQGFRWNDGEKAVQYPTSRGYLIVRRGIYRQYGFAEEGDFFRAAKRGQMIAKTSKGILTLGRLRFLKQPSGFLYLVIPDCPVKLAFPLDSPAEEEGLRKTLAEAFPHARIVAGGGFLGGAIMPTGDFFETFHNAMQTQWRRELIFLAVVGGMAVLTLFLELILNGSIVWAGALTVVFILLVTRFSRQVQEARGGQGNSQSSEDTVSSEHAEPDKQPQQ